MIHFNQLRKMNVARCNSGIFGHSLIDWSATDWGCALAGEVGELCNFLKKIRRGDYRENMGEGLMEVGYEMGDIVTYLDLLAASLNMGLGFWVMEKFNWISTKRKSPFLLRVDKYE